MHLTPYRTVLRIPGMRLFMLVALIARIPMTATSTALTLGVVFDRHLGYGAAGAVSAAFTVGLAVGSPLLGRAVDRRGPRPVLCATGVAAFAFWTTSSLLPYSWLLPAAAVGGALQVPVMGLVRQSLAAKVPEEQRRQAYSLDSMAVELSFMVGPALAVLMITQLGDAVSTLRTVGVAMGLSAAVLWAYNPRITAHRTVNSAATEGADGTDARDGDNASGTSGPGDEQGSTSGSKHARRAWLSPHFVLALGVGGAAATVLAGTDV